MIKQSFEYQCQRIQHLNQNIIGFCLNQNCQETPQFCLKCQTDDSIHKKCQVFQQNLQQIFDLLLSLQDYLKYLVTYLKNKLKVIQTKCTEQLQRIILHQEKFEQILSCLQKRQFYEFKTNFIQITKEVYKLNENLIFTKFLKALHLSKFGSIEEAIQQFDQLIINDEQYCNPHFQKGLLLMKQAQKNQEKWNEAAACFHKASIIDPYYYEAFKNKGICLYNLKQYDEALKCFNNAIQYGPYDEECQFYKGKILQEQEQDEEAIKIFDQILQQNKNHFESYYHKGYSLFKQKNYGQAIEQFDEALKINSNYIELYNLKGQALAQLNQQDQAKKCFSKVIELDPKNLEAYLEKSKLYHDNESRITALNEGINAGIQSQILIFEKGILLQNDEKFTKALEQYDQLINTAVTDVDMDMVYYNKGKYLLFNLGFSLYQLKRYKEAIDYFLKATNLESKSLETSIYLSKSLQRIKNHKDAIKYLDEVINKGFENEDIYYKKGKSLHYLGMHIQAIECFNKALSKCQNLPKALNLQGKSLQSLGVQKQAQLCFEKAKQIESQRPAKNKQYQ